MPFLKINEYYINVDHIFYVKDAGDRYQIYFGLGSTPHSTEVRKSGEEAHRLIQALEAVTKVVTV